MSLPGFHQIWEAKQDELHCQPERSDYQSLAIPSNPKKKSGIFFGPRDGFNGDLLLHTNSGYQSEYSCCNKTFSDAEELARHKVEHVKCSFMGCDFSAHDKLVEFHETHQHRDNLYNKISQTDLEKWRLERRKNFPTIKKIAAAKEISEAKITRGEVIKEKTFGIFRKKRFDSYRNKRFSLGPREKYIDRKRLKALSWQPKRRRMTAGLAYDHPEEDPLSCFLFGRENNDEYANQEAEINPDLHFENVQPVDSKVNTTSSALSLLATYADVSDSDDDPPKETVTQVRNVKLAVNEFVSLTDKIAENSELKESGSEHIKEDIALPEIPSAEKSSRLPLHPVVRLQKRRQSYLTDFLMYLKRPRLLEMLLAGEIRHERNVIMQCVRYICNNNFWGIQNKLSKKTISDINTCEKYHCDETWDDAL